MSDENLEEMDFPVKEGFEMSKEGESEDEAGEVLSEKTEDEVVEEIEKDNEAEVIEEVTGAAKEKNDNDDSTEDVEEVVEKDNEQDDEPAEIDTSSLIRDEIKKATGDQFSSAEELNEAYNNLRETESGKSYVERLNEAVENEYGEGATFADVVEYKSRDFDNMDDLSILEEHLEKTYEGITSEQIEAHMRPYALLNKSDAEIAELIEDGEVTKVQLGDLEARLTRKAMDARSELKEFQDSINIDELQISSPKIADEVVPAESEADANARLERYDSIISSMPDSTFEVGDKENPVSFTLQKTDEDRNGVSEFLKGDNLNGVERNFINKNWTNEDGSVNFEKLSKDVFKIINYDRDVKLGYAQGKSATSKEVKDIDNINFNKKESSGGSQEGAMSQAAMMAIEANK